MGSSRHRGRHPEDAALFAEAALGAVRQACAELSWLLSRGYAAASSLKLVGDRHALTRRQRQAVSRCSAGDEALRGRAARALAPVGIAGEEVVLDGFNCVIILETAFSGGLVLRGLDGCLRDLSSVHGSYRAVSETPRALEAIGDSLAALGCGPARWYLDRPVSNSGRLRATMAEIAERRGWPWEIELCYSPDRELAGSDAVVVSADAWVLDNCRRWTNLVGWIVERQLPSAWIVDLSAAVADPLIPVDGGTEDSGMEDSGMEDSGMEDSGMEDPGT